MTRSEAIQKLNEQVKVYVAKAKELYGVDLNFSVDYSLRGTTAGMACYSKNKIRLNLTCLEVEGGFDHLHDHTVPHEVAHMVQYLAQQFPKDRKSNPPHGRIWQSIMMKFGVTPKRCHSLSLPKTRKSAGITYSYKCACRVHEFSNICHQRSVRGTVYSCRNCRGPITRVQKSSPYQLED